MEFVNARHAALADAVRQRMAGRDLAHDMAHVLRVYRWAVLLAPEAPCDTDLAGAAALVHDLDDTPKSDPARRLSGERSARLAEQLLRAAGYGAAQIAEIASAVRTSSWSRGAAPGSPLGAVLQDADRLDAIGAVGVARVFACHQAMAVPGCELFAAEDPFAESGRTLDDVRYAVDHFPAKLLKLRDGFHLAAARVEAAHRHATLVSFLGALRREHAAARTMAGPPRLSGADR